MTVKKTRNWVARFFCIGGVTGTTPLEGVMEDPAFYCNGER